MRSIQIKKGIIVYTIFGIVFFLQVFSLNYKSNNYIIRTNLPYVCYMVGSILCFILILYNVQKRVNLLLILEIIYSGINTLYILYYENLYIYQIDSMVIIALIQIGFIILYIYTIIRIKQHGYKRFISCLIIDSFALVLYFAALYSSIYNPFFHNGYETLSINTNKSFTECLLTNDFMYFSADCFLGFDKSNVTINYVDYLKLDSIQKSHIESADDSETAVYVIKLMTYFEKVVYVFFLSVVLGYIPSKKRNAEGRHFDVYVSEKKLK